MKIEKIYESCYLYVLVFIIGIFTGVLIIHSMEPNPLMVDCGCGAASQACHNCIMSMDWNSSWCKWFL